MEMIGISEIVEIAGLFEEIPWLEISGAWRYAEVELSGMCGMAGVFGWNEVENSKGGAAEVELQARR